MGRYGQLKAATEPSDATAGHSENAQHTEGHCDVDALPITWDAHGGHILPMERSEPLHIQAFPRDLDSGWELNIGPSHQ